MLRTACTRCAARAAAHAGATSMHRARNTTSPSIGAGVPGIWGVSSSSAAPVSWQAASITAVTDSSSSSVQASQSRVSSVYAPSRGPTIAWCSGSICTSANSNNKTIKP
eukprot:9504023-Pyramimonas_sp.AAC.1